MKVQDEMATRISVDTVSAVGSMSAFRNAITATANAWKAQETALKNSGDYTQAAKVKLDGLTQAMELQRAKIEELRSRQDGLDQSNEKQANQWLKLEKQINQANRQLASYEAQAQSAHNSANYYASGLATLQRQMKLNDDVSRSYTASLRAQGRGEEANRAELKGLQSSLASLEKQQTKQKFLLSQIEHQSGKTSDAYKKQQIQLNKTGEEIGKTEARMRELDKALNPPKTSAWEWLRVNILQVDKAEQSAREHAISFGQVLKANIMGGWIQQGFSSITSGLRSVVVNGTQVAQAGAAMQARWKNIGASAAEIKQLSNQVTELKTNTNLTAQSVNALQTRFYGMTHSVDQTRILTKGVASLSDQLKLSDNQANAFAGGLSRIESSGKVTSASLGRLEKQAPGLTAAMSKASGMTQDAFKQLVSSGKMTSDQFNQILANSAKNYDKNARAFRNSSGGAMHRLQQEWVTTQATLAKPLLKVSATGLNELSAALNNKDTQRGLQLLAKGMATAAVRAAQFIGFLARHQNTVKVFGAVLLGLVASFKAMQGAVIAVDVVNNFTKLMTDAREVKGFSAAIRGLGVAFRFMTGPIGIAIVAITAIGAALVELYKHNKRFRDFVNGIASAAKNGLKNVGKFFSNTWESVTKGLSSFWNSTKKSFSNGWKDLKKNTSEGADNVKRGWDELSSETVRSAQQMFNKHKSTFQAGYKVIQDQTTTWHDLVSGHWDRLGEDTERTAQDMFKFNRKIFSDMYNKLNDMTGGRLGDMLKVWQDIFGKIKDAVGNAVGSVHRHFVDLVSGVLKPFKTMIDNVKGGINWILDKVGGSKIGGDFSISMPSYANGTNDTHPGGFAKVNDGLTAHYREMFMTKDGQVGMFPAKRNLILPLPKGTSVLDGERSYQLSRMFGMIPHYADGVGNAFSSLLSKVGDATDDVLGMVDKIMSKPVEFMESVFQKFVHVSTPVKFAAELVKDVPVYIAKQMGNWIKKQFETLANPGGAGVERWRPYIIKAFKTLGVEATATKVSKLLKQIQTESGGNPTVPQKVWDINMANGNPAQGLLQFIPSTFNHWAIPGHKQILNGYDQILAAINALEHGGEGGWGNVGQGHGWANGGLISNHGVYEIAEKDMPEYVIPTDISRRSRAYQLLGEIVTRFRNDDPTLSHNAQFVGENNRQSDALSRKLDELLSKFDILLRLSGDQVDAIKAQGSLDMQQLYKKEAKDARMRQLGF